MTTRRFTQRNQNYSGIENSDQASYNISMSIEIDEDSARNEKSPNRNLFACFKLEKISSLPPHCPQSHSKIYPNRKPVLNFPSLPSDMPDSFSSKNSRVEYFTSKKRNPEQKLQKPEGGKKKFSAYNFINNIISDFGNYKSNASQFYFEDNHLLLTKKTQPYVEIKVICTSENTDLRCVTNSYIIGEHGLNSSMKNHDRDVTTFGRQQINADMIRPNDIMLYTTD